MSETSSHIYERLTAHQIAQVNQCCDQFEKAWREGQTPMVSDHLSSAPESIRKVLLHELVVVDATYRRQSNSAFDAIEYYKELPYLDQQWLNENTPSTLSTSLVPRSPASVPTLPRYEIVGEIGRGGMGVVYQALDRRLGRTVCLKALHHETCQQPEWLLRFRREARVVSSLNHPNICTLYELEEQEDRPYLVLEWIEGHTFRQILQKEHKTQNLLQLFAQVARALEAAHAAGVVHRDIKPENLMVRSDGLVKVLDFGLARLHEASPPNANHADDFATDGGLLGTPTYMSPEQARGELTTSASDIFSLGTVLFEMLTGTNPFRADTGLEAMHKIGQKPTPSVAGYTESLPNELISLVSAMHRQNPDQRPAAHQVSQTLVRLHSETAVDQPLGASQSSTDSTVAQQATETPLLSHVPTNLPFGESALTGRGAELMKLVAQLATQRVTTVLGAGGVGKTALAYEAARQASECFPGGVWLCEFAPLLNQDGLLQVLAGVLDGNAGSVNKLEDVVARLAGDPTLVIFDNCEHVLGKAAELIERLAAELPNLTVLATSRQALKIAGEYVLQLEGLEAVDAATLFTTRANQPGLQSELQSQEIIGQIVRRLEGLPLAIELAAPKLTLMTPVELLEALDNQSATLKVGRRPQHRQSAIEQTIAWSFDLLESEEQEALLSLSVFASWFTPEAAIEVSGLGPATKLHLTGLVEQSVVARKEDRGRSRYRLLEPIRQFCQARIAGDKLSAARERHARYYAKRAIEKLSLGIAGFEELECLRALDAEWPDLRQAVAWGRQNTVFEVAIKPCIALARTAYWQMRHELFDWILAGEKALPEQVANDAEAVAGVATSYWLQERHEEMQQKLSALETLTATPLSVWLNAYLAFICGDHEQAIELWNRHKQLSEEANLDHERRFARCTLEVAAYVLVDSSDPGIEQQMKVANRQNVETGWLGGRAIYDATEMFIAMYRGDLPQARSAAMRCVEQANTVRARFIEVSVLAMYASISVADGEENAEEKLQGAIDTYRELLEGKKKAMLPFVARGLVVAMASCGATEAAARGSVVAERLRGVGGVNEFTPDYPKVLEQLCSELGEQRFGELREEGRRLTVQELLEIAEKVATQYDGKS